MDLSSIFTTRSQIQVIQLAVDYKEWRVEARPNKGCTESWLLLMLVRLGLSSYSDKNRLEGYGLCAAVIQEEEY